MIAEDAEDFRKKTLQQSTVSEPHNDEDDGYKIRSVENTW